MEGFRCSHPNCHISDFLPFICNFCNGLYCLEHRSQFVHSCIDRKTDVLNETLSNSSSTIFSHAVLDLAASTDIHLYGSKEHLQIKNNNEHKLIDGQLNTSTITKLDKLKGTWAKDSSAKQKNISKATSRILLKNKSAGNKEIPLENRIYLHITFAVTKMRSVLFFSKYQLISEILEYISNNMSTVAYGNGANSYVYDKNVYTLVMYDNTTCITTENSTTSINATANTDLTSWEQWNIYQPLQYYYPDDISSTTHSNVEEVIVSPILITTVVNNQKKWENNAGVSNMRYEKQEQVWYRALVEGGKEEGEYVRAVVKEVHVEGTEVYYSIYIPHLDKERQTIADRLCRALPLNISPLVS